MIPKAELEFRGVLSAAMRGSWDLTWHEDGRVNPGVPDLSFVMKNGPFETGWIELKAVFNTTPPFTWKLEQSQYQWMKQHEGRIPILILVAAGERCWLFNHDARFTFQKPITDISWLEVASIVACDFKDIRASLAPWLRDLTNRNRT